MKSSDIIYLMKLEEMDLDKDIKEFTNTSQVNQYKYLVIKDVKFMNSNEGKKFLISKAIYNKDKSEITIVGSTDNYQTFSLKPIFMKELIRKVRKYK